MDFSNLDTQLVKDVNYVHFFIKVPHGINFIKKQFHNYSLYEGKKNVKERVFKLKL